MRLGLDLRPDRSDLPGFVDLLGGEVYHRLLRLDDALRVHHLQAAELREHLLRLDAVFQVEEVLLPQQGEFLDGVVELRLLRDQVPLVVEDLLEGLLLAVVLEDLLAVDVHEALERADARLGLLREHLHHLLVLLHHHRLLQEQAELAVVHGAGDKLDVHHVQGDVHRLPDVTLRRDDELEEGIEARIVAEERHDRRELLFLHVDDEQVRVVDGDVRAGKARALHDMDGEPHAFYRLREFRALGVVGEKPDVDAFHVRIPVLMCVPRDEPIAYTDGAEKFKGFLGEGRYFGGGAAGALNS